MNWPKKQYLSLMKEFGITDVGLVKTKGDQSNWFILFYSSNHLIYM